jgi:hypothetical protein
MGFILRNTAIASDINQRDTSEPHLLRVDLPDYPHEFEYPDGALFYFLKSQEWPQLMRLSSEYGWRPTRDYSDFCKNTGYDFTMMTRDDALRMADAIVLALPSVPVDQTDTAEHLSARELRRQRKLVNTSRDPRLDFRGQRARLSNLVEFLRSGCSHEERVDSDVWLYDWTDHERNEALAWGER